MPNEDKWLFDSLYGAEGKLTAQQFLAEGMVARKARKDGVDLPRKFWNADRWKREFLLQLRFANALLKVYPVEAIIRALRTREGKNVYSFAAKWLHPLIEEAAREIERGRNNRAESPPAPVVTETKAEPPRPAFSQKKSQLDKLKELD